MKLGDLAFAWLMRRASRLHEPLVAERKRKLLAGISGNLLEIGPGSGVNLQYLPPSVRWTGFEPNAPLAREIPVPATGRLHRESYRPGLGPFDSALSTLVLCSVPDPLQILRAIHSDLRPGAIFVFLEHVAAPAGSKLLRQQRALLPLWRFCAGGCHPNRETEQLIRQAGFDITSIERFHLPLWLASPHIAGVAIKR